MRRIVYMFNNDNNYYTLLRLHWTICLILLAACALILRVCAAIVQGEQYITTLTFKMANRHLAKRFWRLSAEIHSFFRSADDTYDVILLWCMGQIWWAWMCWLAHCFANNTVLDCCVDFGWQWVSRRIARLSVISLPLRFRSVFQENSIQPVMGERSPTPLWEGAVLERCEKSVKGIAGLDNFLVQKWGAGLVEIANGQIAYSVCCAIWWSTDTKRTKAPNPNTKQLWSYQLFDLQCYSDHWIME